MQDILKKLEAIYVECEAIKTNLINQLGQVQATAEQQKEFAGKLSRQKQLQDERETVLEKIEDVIQYRKDAQVRVEQAEATIADFHNRVVSFTAYEEATKKELRHKEEALGKRESAVSEKEANLEVIILDKVKGALRK